jgi:hypothetical protein
MAVTLCADRELNPLRLDYDSDDRSRSGHERRPDRRVSDFYFILLVEFGRLAI